MFESRPLEIPPYRGFVAAAHDGPALNAVVSSFPAILRSPSAETLHEGRNRITAVRLSPEVEAVVKVFGARGFHKLKTLILPSKGMRAWTGAVALSECGFGTPRTYRRLRAASAAGSPPKAFSSPNESAAAGKYGTCSGPARNRLCPV